MYLSLIISPIIYVQLSWEQLTLDITMPQRKAEGKSNFQVTAGPINEISGICQQDSPCIIFSAICFHFFAIWSYSHNAFNPLILIAWSLVEGSYCSLKNQRKYHFLMLKFPRVLLCCSTVKAGWRAELRFLVSLRWPSSWPIYTGYSRLSSEKRPLLGESCQLFCLKKKYGFNNSR